MKTVQPIALFFVAIILTGCACGAGSSPAATNPTDDSTTNDDSTILAPERGGPAIEAAPREPVAVSPI